ncbi:MAG: hypothetical protein JSS82_06095 [Bacteroidetes bacterium]|nr:hypothetical protein [Bacteroidota bacterium]
MKKLAAATLLFLSMAQAFTSCKKKKDPDPISPIMYIPATDGSRAQSLMGANTGGNELAAPLSNVWGILMSTGFEFNLKDTSGQPYNGYQAWQEAFFCGPDGTGYADAKAVSINNTPIDKKGNIYFTESAWRDAWLNHWEVTRSANVPEVSQNTMGSLPYFAGTVPAQVVKANGLTLYLGSNIALGADSAYFIMRGGSTIARSNTVSPKGSGNAIISAQQLSSMQNSYFTFENHVCYGVLVDVVVYKDTIQTFEGKQFAFVTQREITKNVVLK